MAMVVVVAVGVDDGFRVEEEGDDEEDDEVVKWVVNGSGNVK